MENFEKVEALREKANVSFEDAKEAMEACNYDMLDAMIYLEKQGKVNVGSTASYTTFSGTDTSQEFEQAQRSYEDSCQRTSIGEVISKFGKWCGRVIQKSLEIDFCVTKNENLLLKVPVLVLVLALLIAFGLITILLVVGLFCDCKYYFQGMDTTTINLNQICERASETCENIKKDFQNK
ncbi:MAG: UBA/TS-N domain protein [Lachnospiraceae bacterium]|nr:UBA/TS-N domain protein [Lachnospiraceae bacterium]MBR4084938.1 UBA/TS-N domain protein [Lachnospiraceae bacterium]